MLQHIDSKPNTLARQYAEANPTLLTQFFLAYQPKVQNGRIVALEALLRPTPVSKSFFEFLEDINDTIALDLSVVVRCVSDMTNYNVQIPVAINLHPTSLLCTDFVDTAIRKVAGKRVIFELVEYEEVNMNETFHESIAKIKAAGIKVSVDDFGKDFATAALALSIDADEVKFDMSLIQDIDTNFIKFKHISFLYAKIKTLCTEQIVFEGVETKRQKDLIELFADKPIMQGYYFFKPMLLSEIVKLDMFHNEPPIESKIQPRNPGVNLDFILYEHMCSASDEDLLPENLNTFIKKHDILGLVYNEDANITMKNLRNIYFTRSSAINNGVMALVDSTEKLVVFRNDEGVVIYDNTAHREFVGSSIIGLNPQDLVEENEHYRICLKKDKKLLYDKELMFIQETEEFDGTQYDTIREKMVYNNKDFIITTICPSNVGLVDSHKDELTKCYSRSFIKYHLTSYNEQIVAFIDLNGFKLINDTKGHAVGDECLVDFACLVKSSLREEDVVIRYGGDEFVVIFNSSSREDIENRLNILNVKISRFFMEKGLVLSFTYGLAEVTNHDLNAAIDLADQEMYANKQRFYENATA